MLAPEQLLKESEGTDTKGGMRKNWVSTWKRTGLQVFLCQCGAKDLELGEICKLVGTRQRGKAGRDSRV